MNLLQTQEFTIIEPPGLNTIAFLVTETDEKMLPVLPPFTLEKLENTKYEENGRTKKTFYITMLDQKEYTVIIITFGPGKTFINYGVVKDNILLPGEQPMQLKHETLYNREEYEAKEVKFMPNDKRQILIIDPIDGQVMRPVIFKNQKTNELIGKYMLKPYKHYVALEVSL